VLYVPNKENDLFHLYYRLDMGSWNNRLLPMAAQYLQYLGTAAHPTAEISRAFYSIACNFSVNATTGDDDDQHYRACRRISIGL
jgi:hypothetical protein